MMPLRALAALALALQLSACGDSAPPAAIARGAAGSRDAVAVARGRVEVAGGLLEVMAPAAATVDTVQVREGDKVQRGQVLVTLAAAPAQHALAIAEAELQLAQARQQAARDPQATAVAAAEVQVARTRAAAARAQLQALTVTAAQDGTVLVLNAQPGMRAVPQGPKPLMVLLPRRPLMVRAELNEAFVASVRPGMKVDVVTDGPVAPGVTPAAGKVVRLSPVYGPSRLDEDPARAGSRVLECWVELDRQDDNGLRAGQYVRVNFHD